MNLRNAVPSIALLGAAAGLFVFATKLPVAGSTAPVADASPVPVSAAPAAAQAPTAPAPVAPPAAVPTPVAAAVPPAPAPAPAPAVAQAPAPAPAPTPAPAPAPAPSPAPMSAPTPAPTPSPSPNAPSKNPDDSPTRTHSGKVEVSTDTALPPALGPKAPLVEVLVISDFQCPVCRRALDATHQIAEEFPGEVRLVFWNHALDMHRNAANAAAAGVAAHLQGKFWEMHDRMFESQGQLDELSLETYAQGIGLDMAKYKADIADEKTKQRVKDEGALAEALDAQGTPALVVNGKLQVGWGSWNGFRGMVEQELTEARALKAKGMTEAQILELRARQNCATDKAFDAYKKAVLTPQLAKGGK